MDNSAIITATVTVMIAFKFLQRHEVISSEALAAGRISGEVRYEDDQKLSQILSSWRPLSCALGNRVTYSLRHSLFKITLLHQLTISSYLFTRWQCCSSVFAASQVSLTTTRQCWFKLSPSPVTASFEPNCLPEIGTVRYTYNREYFYQMWSYLWPCTAVWTCGSEWDVHRHSVI